MNARNPIVITLVAAACIVVALLTYSGTHAPQSTSPTVTNFEENLATTTPKKNLPYASAKYHFSLEYPRELQVEKYDEGAGDETITFQNGSGSLGFQIYVTPYKEAKITQDQFQTDDPSGVMVQPTDIIIGGVRATMFFGKNDEMGDTREVWFIHGGFLYEVMTYKELDSWLSEILGTFRFL